MPRILIINPNTTESITALLASHAKQVVASDVAIDTFTARFGESYISSEASYAIAGHAVLDAIHYATADRGVKPDAVLIGCFGDPGLFALREVSNAPVSGLAEASFIEAAKYGRFAIVTGGERWKPILERLAGALGFSEQLCGITTVAPTGAQLAADPVAAEQLLAAACQQAAKDFSVEAIILGGAGLAGMAARIQGRVDVPVIDSVQAGARHASQLAHKPRGASL